MAVNSPGHGNLEDAELRAAFARLRDRPATLPEGLQERCLDRVEVAITTRDLAELGTSVLVTEFLGPILDLLAAALGFREQGENRG